MKNKHSDKRISVPHNNPTNSLIYFKRLTKQFTAKDLNSIMDTKSEYFMLKFHLKLFEHSKQNAYRALMSFISLYSCGTTTRVATMASNEASDEIPMTTCASCIFELDFELNELSLSSFGQFIVPLFGSRREFSSL